MQRALLLGLTPYRWSESRFSSGLSHAQLICGYPCCFLHDVVVPGSTSSPPVLASCSSCSSPFTSLSSTLLSSSWSSSLHFRSMGKQTRIQIYEAPCSMQSKKNSENLEFPVIETFWKEVEENFTLSLPWGRQYPEAAKLECLESSHNQHWPKGKRLLWCVISTSGNAT